MNSLRVLVSLLLIACITVPILIGASCPPPSQPPFVSVITSPSNQTQGLPPCEPNRVCVSIVNQTCIGVEAILYIHDGFDLEGRYVTRTAIECCENENADAPCPCFRSGSDIGEMQLRAPELFLAENRYAFSTGETIETLDARSGRLAAQGERITESIPCDEAKTIGIEVAPEGDLPLSPDEDAGPDYRCALVDVTRGEGDVLVEDVLCGATIQYAIVDRNDCASPDLTQIRIETNVSADCTDSEVGEADDGGDGDGDGGEDTGDDDTDDMAGGGA